MELIYTLAGSLFLYFTLLFFIRKARESIKRVINYSAWPLFLILAGFFVQRAGFLSEIHFKAIIFFSLYSLLFLFPLSIIRNIKGREIKLKTIVIIGFSVVAIAFLQKLGYISTIFSFLSIPRVSIGEEKISLNGIIIAAIIFYLSFRLSRVIEKVSKKRMEKLPFMDVTRTSVISMVIRYSVVVIGVLVALGILNVNFTSLTVLFGALGVGIGFGLKEIINNLISGFILLSDKSVVHNDLIEVNGILGKVQTVGIRTTVINTFDNVEIIVPNTNLVNNELINYTHSNSIIRIKIPIGVSYSSDPFQVRELLIENVSKLEMILKDPPVNVIFSDFGGSSLDFNVVLWTDNPLKKKRIESEARYVIWETLKANNIEIPFPQQDVHIKKN